MEAQEFHPAGVSVASGLCALPREIIHDIFGQLERTELLNLRLQNQYLNTIASSLAFRSLRLVGYGSSPEALIRIARSDKLRGLVHELTCDTAIDPFINDFEAYGYKEPTEMPKALDFIRYFVNLKVLHLRFLRDCWYEAPDFRLRFLHSIFSSVAGKSYPIDWQCHYKDEFRQHYHDAYDDDADDDDESDQQSEDEEGESPLSNSQSNEERSEDGQSDPVKATDDVEDDEASESEYEQQSDDEDSFFDLRQIPDELLDNRPSAPNNPLHITTLTISNLAARRDARLMENPVFEEVLSLKSLINFKILIAPFSKAYPDDQDTSPEKFSMYAHLPTIWLSPCVRGNLRELSLYSQEPWGWFPKIDLSELGRLPNLRILALGNYTFSHQCQVDWISSLNLEELYLDRCGVLRRVSVEAARLDGGSAYLNRAVNATTSVPNQGYLNPGWRFSEHDVQMCRRYPYPLRWNAILEQWRVSLCSLKVFKMGYGSWHRPPPETVRANRNVKSPFGIESIQRFSDNAFRYYSCPPPGGQGAQYQQGTGIDEKHNYALEYLKFERNGLYRWSHTFFHGSESDSEPDSEADDCSGLVLRDELAWKSLVESTRSRR